MKTNQRLVFVPPMLPAETIGRKVNLAEVASCRSESCKTCTGLGHDGILSVDVRDPEGHWHKNFRPCVCAQRNFLEKHGSELAVAQGDKTGSMRWKAKTPTDEAKDAGLAGGAS